MIVAIPEGKEVDVTISVTQEGDKIVRKTKRGVIVKFGGINNGMPQTVKGSHYAQYLIEFDNETRIWANHSDVKVPPPPIPVLTLISHFEANVMKFRAPDSKTLHEVLAFLKTKYDVK